MAQYSGMQLTNNGLRLQMQATINSVPLHFTKVMLGNGMQPDGTELKNVTEMIAQKLELPITGTKVTGDGTGTISCLVSNEKITDPFHVREIGIYAQDGENEVLYSYAYAGENSDYMPAGGGPNVVNYILTVYVVIDRVTQVTANVDVNLAFATTEELQAHILNKNLHVVHDEDITQEEITNFWVEKNDNKLHRAKVDLAQKAILGNDWQNIKSYNGRLTQLERETANLMLAQEAAEVFQDYNGVINTIFTDLDDIDTFSCDVTSVVAGDDSINVSAMQGIVPYANYTISDGVNQETVRISACVKSGETNRVILSAPVQYDYISGGTILIRTTAYITDGQVQGAGEVRTASWRPDMVWKGITGNTPTEVKMETKQENASNFTIDGDIGFTSDGEVTLI